MPGGGGGLDPVLQQYMQQQRQQQLWGMLTQAGLGLMSANRQGQSPMRALAAGMAQGMGQGRSGGGGLMPILRAQDLLNKQRDRQKEQRQDFRQDFSRRALTAGDKYDPQTGILWDQPPAPGRAPRGLLDLEKRGLASAAYPEAFGKGLMAEMFPKPQERFEVVQNPYGRGGVAQRSTTTGKFSGYQAKSGDLTIAQQRENAEIAQARKALDQEGLSHDDVMRISKSQRDTGRDNPEYSPFINTRVRQATRRKYGDDSEYAAVYGRYLTPGPEFSDPAGPKALPPGVSAEKPGFIDQARDFLGFGGAASQPNPPGAEGLSTPRLRGSRGRFSARRTGSAASIPRMTVQDIDDLINQRGDTLSPAELRAVQTRLKALGL